MSGVCILCASVPTCTYTYLASLLLCSLYLLFQILCFDFSSFFLIWNSPLSRLWFNILKLLSPAMSVACSVRMYPNRPHVFPKGFLMTYEPESLLNTSAWESVVQSSAEGWNSWTIHSSSRLFVPKVCGPGVWLAFLHDKKSIVSFVSEPTNSKVYLKLIYFKLNLNLTDGVADSQHLLYVELAPFLI